MLGLWQVANARVIGDQADFGLAGIINLTPDSFFDGGKYLDTNSALEQALNLAKSGATMIDLGAESSRPGSMPLSDTEEIARLLPLLCKLKQTNLCYSVDTYHAKTASLALQYGASIINDISACAYDPDLLDVLIQYKPGYVLMHGNSNLESMHTGTNYTLQDILKFFELHLNRLVKAGLPENCIVLDPGIGFGKSPELCWQILQNIQILHSFQRPIYMGISMKSIFAWLFKELGTSDSLENRAKATVTTSLLLWQQGVFWHRVHQVAPLYKTLTLASKFVK